MVVKLERTRLGFTTFIWNRLWIVAFRANEATFVRPYTRFHMTTSGVTMHARFNVPRLLTWRRCETWT